MINFEEEIAKHDARIEELERALASLKAQQPSAGVVLPERRTTLPDDDPVRVAFSSTWNDCLDEVARLNPCRAQAVLDLGQAATDVLAERKRQITEEGWTPEHDDHHTYGEIADAAACYALWGGGSSPHNFDQFWPWDRSWLKFGQARQMLIKSGALILAEIERLDRAAAQQKESGDE